MYFLMTMTEIDDFVRPTDHIREEDFVRFGKHFMGPVQAGQDPEYSERLRDLVRDCLNPKIELRPTASSLVTRTRAGLEPYLISAATGNVPAAE
jgi:NHR1 homology to TAF